MTIEPSCHPPVAARGRTAISPAAPAAVMAIGIFGIASLPHLPLFGPPLAAPLAAALVGLWLFLAASCVRILRGWREALLARPAGELFALGTWVAGTIVTAKLVLAALPSLSMLATGLEWLALPLFAGYARVVIGCVPAAARDPVAARASGSFLLFTVAIQAVALAVPDVMPLSPPWLDDLLIACGVAAYAAGVVLIVERYRRQRRPRLADDWENTNCILHGAMSITGLAAVSSGGLAEPVCSAIWIYAAGVFLLVEGVEAARLVARVRDYGWRRAVVVYDTSQWARNFTFGMFYAFTLAAVERFGAASGWLAFLQKGVLTAGPYVVAGLLLVEIGLFLGSAGEAS
jgi:hypothetical protein